MADIDTLYENDFLAWSKQQAEALRAAARAGSNQLLDWRNLAEEIEDLGNSLKFAVESQISRIIQHQVKLAHSPAVEPRKGWRRTIRQARAEIDRLEMPSLRRARYTEEQVLGDWFPEEPAK